MCLSRFHLVLSLPSPGIALARNSAGATHAVSLLALDGPAPRVGEWLVVHSGYAIDRVRTSDLVEETGAPGDAPTGQGESGS